MRTVCLPHCVLLLFRGNLVLNYSLKASLTHSRTVPHESVIDAILHPEIRDRMILLRGRFDLVDCLHDYRFSVKIHGDDVLSHHNWEILVRFIVLPCLSLV